MRFIWSHRLIRAIVLTVLITNLLEAPLPVVAAVLARETYGGATELGLMYGVLGGSALVGALAYSGFGHRLPRRLLFVWCFSVVPLMYLALAAEPPFLAALVALAVGGLAAGPINPLLFTVASEAVPTRLRGRVFGATRAGAWASIPLGILLGGLAVETLGVAATLLVIGLSFLAVTAYGFFNPAFREMDRRPESAAGPTRVDGARPGVRLKRGPRRSASREKGKHALAAQPRRLLDSEDLEHRRRDVEQMRVGAAPRLESRAGDDVEPVLGVIRIVWPGVVLECLDSLVAADRADRAPEEVSEHHDEVRRDALRARRRAPRACRPSSGSSCPRRPGSPRCGARDRRARTRTGPAGITPSGSRPCTFKKTRA